MFTLGGAMSGYCSTGRVRIPAIPASMIAMAMTQAKTGRSMKMRLIMAGGSPPLRSLGAGPSGALARQGPGRHGRDGHVGLDPVQALGDHPFAGLQAGRDDPLV